MTWLKLLKSCHKPGRHRAARPYCRLVLEELEPRLAPSVSMLTYHNDNYSAGANLSETALTLANVNSSTFGKLFTTGLDGQVFAQPLYVANQAITVGGITTTHNVVYVATENDSLYAIDADSGTVLWHDSFTNPANGVTPVPAADVGNTLEIAPVMGITGTPVIDTSTNSIYFDTYTKEVVGGKNHYVYRLHAVSLSDGSEQFGGPLTIADTIVNAPHNFTYVSGPSVNTNGGGHVQFNALRQLQRPGLTQTPDGTIYLAFASHGDVEPYHGWVLGFNHQGPGQTLQLTAAFNTTPNGKAGGIWQGGGRIAVDSSGFLYFETGNGTFDTKLNAQGFPVNGDYGDSFVKLAVDPSTSPTNQNINGWGLKVVDYFTPHNQAALNTGDIDLGSGAPMLLPDGLGGTAHPNLLIGGGKEGTLYLIDRNNMGHFNATKDNIVQELPHVLSGVWDTPAFFNNTIYYVGTSRHASLAKTFSISNGKLSTQPTSLSLDKFAFPGSTPSISANGASNGIAWDIALGTNQLRAYDATSYAKELYTSDQAAGGRDALGTAVKFSVPTVVNGKVFVGTATGLDIYGLLP
ncbi:MAG TPA: PQQ-binding-like beta-propeller repeat protein [Gemmataceae bacterium]|nr:PQQ-binding-like beta-propeller repeat protein [Gemmataceae bacterium]